MKHYTRKGSSFQIYMTISLKGFCTHTVILCQRKPSIIMFPDYSILNRAYKHPGRTQVTNTYTLAPLLRSYTRTIYFTPYLHVDEGSAGEVLGGSERDEPEHGEAAVP